MRNKANQHRWKDSLESPHILIQLKMSPGHERESTRGGVLPVRDDSVVLQHQAAHPGALWTPVRKAATIGSRWARREPPAK